VEKLQVLVALEFLTKLEIACWVAALMGFFIVLFTFIGYLEKEISKRAFLYSLSIFTISILLGTTLNYISNSTFTKLITRSFSQKECQFLKTKILREQNPYAIEIYFTRCENKRR